MAYKVILIEKNQKLSDKIIYELKNSPNFTVASTYKNANAAISQGSMFSPDLFLIDVDDEESLSMLPAFVDIFPNADILGFISKWRADPSKAVQRAGALGCILFPFSAKDIEDAIKLYKIRGKKGLARVIAFFSPKGRAGRTTVASILALTLAAKTGERVLLIDADLQFGDIPIFFDVEPKHTVVDATQDIKMLNPLNIESYFYKIKDNLYLLSSPDRPEYAELVDVDSFIATVRLSCNLFRYVLIDLPAGFNPVSIGLSKLADTVIMMAMINNGFEIQHLKRALEVFKASPSNVSPTNDKKKIYPVFTRVNPCNDDEKHKIEDKLGFPVSDILPNEYKMISIANSGRLSKGLPMDSLLMQNMMRITNDIIAGKK